MAAVTLPYFKHFTADDVQETEFLSIPATGVFHRLQVKFFQLGALPRNEDEIRILARWPAKDRNWPAIRDELRRYVFDDNWRNPRWEAILEKSGGTSAKRSSAAQARWSRRDAPDTSSPPPDRYDGPDEEPEYRYD
jgi:uncharacterized protein YdaU (DUF1376 family)